MTTITAEMEAELIRLFTRFDTNRSGLIEETEFGKILDSLGFENDAELRRQEFAAIDADDDGKITFGEFSSWWIDTQ